LCPADIRSSPRGGAESAECIWPTSILAAALSAISAVLPLVAIIAILLEGGILKR
jgi:hypothetical protein